jgi:murein DD-endopeptidase MepM/ murein hydrolase activator NlpD
VTKPFCVMSHAPRPSRRAAAVVVAAALALTLGGSWTAAAQLGGDLPLEPTTTTEPPPPPPPSEPEPEPAPQEEQSTTTTTQAPGPSLTPSPSPSPSPAPSPGPAPGPAPAEQPGEEPLPPAGDDGETPPSGSGSFPPELQAMMNSVVRSGANNTRGLLAALEPLAEFGLDPTQRAIVGFGRFPVAGEAVWSHDWWFPRFGPGWRLHQGIDIFAAYGTPVRAPVDGCIRITNRGLGGLSVYVVQPDKTYWYLTHLSAIGEGISEGDCVKTGHVVGHVGDSGNARGGKPHLHMEIHPNGGGPIDPKAIVDKFVADAVAMAPALIEAYAAAQRVAGETGEVAAQPVVEPPEPELSSPLSPRAALLWTSAVNPAGGALRIAEADAVAAAEQLDWNTVRATQGALAQRRTAATRQVELWLAPLVPKGLAFALRS